MVDVQSAFLRFVATHQTAPALPLCHRLELDQRDPVRAQQAGIQVGYPYTRPVRILVEPPVVAYLLPSRWRHVL
jgi:hypothetical protein